MAEPGKLAGPTTLKVPEGDNRERLVCDDCGFVLYRNPKVVVGAVIADQGRVLLCRRAINPRRGFWTIPAGYLELNETTAQGAAREAREEAGATIAIEGVLAVYSVPRISQVQVIYAARLAAPDIAPGVETLEARLALWDEIPWDDLAFPSVRWALGHWRDRILGGDTTTRANPPGELGDY
ncbi:MAG: NUDIX hydrolase [Alphaproteobacteria bacterium]